MASVGASARARQKVDQLSRHPSDYNTYTQPQRRFRLTRRSMRQMRKYIIYALGALLFLFVWNTLDPPTEQSALSRYTSRRLSRIRKGAKGGAGVGGRLHLTWPGWEGIRNIYAFGDSHTETGFDPEGPEPTPSNPLGNPAWPGRTGNYGPNYVSHLTGTFNSSYIRTYNMARGGLPNQKRALDDGTGASMALRDQIDEVFLPHYGRSSGRSRIPSGSGWMQDDTLFVLFHGVDDFVTEYMFRPEGAPRNITNTELGLFEYENNLGQLYDYGGRNFLVIGIPALEESTMIRNCPHNDSLKVFGAETVDINGRLAFTTQSFALNHPDATVFFFNNLKYSVNTRVDPTDYPETKEIVRMEGYCYFYSDRSQEVVEDTEACGNKLEQFYWRDEMHHTQPYHRLIARMMVQEMRDLENALPYEFY